MESAIHVVRGKARMRRGGRLEELAEVGSFVIVPQYVPHREVDASPDEPLQYVRVRSGSEWVVAGLDIDPPLRHSMVGPQGGLCQVGAASLKAGYRIHGACDSKAGGA